MHNNFNAETEAKREWARPELRTIEAGSAEARPGSNDDLQGTTQTS